MINGKRPSVDSVLLFELKQRHLADCTSKLQYNFTIIKRNCFKMFQFLYIALKYSLHNWNTTSGQSLFTHGKLSQNNFEQEFKLIYKCNFYKKIQNFPNFKKIIHVVFNNGPKGAKSLHYTISSTVFSKDYVFSWLRKPVLII